MATSGKFYAVRDAGTPSRPGRVHQTYPYTLRGLQDALEDARLRSYGRVSILVVVLEDRRGRVIRRYERGHEMPIEGRPSA